MQILREFAAESDPSRSAMNHVLAYFSYPFRALLNRTACIINGRQLRNYFRALQKSQAVIKTSFRFATPNERKKWLANFTITQLRISE